MNPVAISGFRDDEIRSGKLMGIIKDRHVWLANIARIDELCFLAVFAYNDIYEGTS